MPPLSETLAVLAVPFVACLVIASLHCYMGLHVIKRGVIFVDLALAQSAALGAAVALFLSPIIWGDAHEHAGHAETGVALITEADLADQLDLGDEDMAAVAGAADEDARVTHPEAEEDEHGRFGYALSLTFALLGAVILSVGRVKDERVPHEAIIGIIFVVCAALSVLILSKAPHGHEKMEAMLIGSILFVSWPQVATMLVLYLILGAIHVGFRKYFLAISEDVVAADRAGMRVKYWDCLFYGTFALMVTQSVTIAGVFVVFSYLIIPAACSLLLTNGFRSQLICAWIIAVVGTVAGLALSACGDMPTGSSLVSCFGAMLVVCAAIRVLLQKTQVGVA